MTNQQTEATITPPHSSFLEQRNELELRAERILKSMSFIASR